MDSHPHYLKASVKHESDGATVQKQTLHLAARPLDHLAPRPLEPLAHENLFGSIRLRELLMFFTEEIIDRLDRVEGTERCFDKNRVPVGHGAVPEAGKFQGLQFTSVL